MYRENISPLFAPRRPGHKSRVHTLYYIHRTAIAYAYHTESPLLCTCGPREPREG